MASNSKNLAELLNSDVTLTATDIANDAVTTAKIADGAITPAKTAGIGGGGKNVIVNGEMMVSQRKTSSSNVGNQYVLDRFAVYKQNTGSTYTCSQNTVTDLPGFSHSLKMDCTTADTSIASNEEVKIIHKLEGQECQRFAKGHGSDALPMTLSFYVKTTKTGVYVVEIYDRDNTREVSGSYTVANANWNRYTINFPADALGKLDNDINSSLELSFWLVAGSAVQGGTLNTAWRSATDPSSATGQVNFADSTANDWEITGIQFETGSAATPFEHRLSTDHLLACQRYYNRTKDDVAYGMLGGSFMVASGNRVKGVMEYPVEMRAQPAVSCIGTNAGAWVAQQGDTALAGTIAFDSAWNLGGDTRNTWLDFTGNTNGTQGYSVHFYRGNRSVGDGSACLQFDAEL